MAKNKPIWNTKIINIEEESYSQASNKEINNAVKEEKVFMNLNLAISYDTPNKVVALKLLVKFIHDTEEEKELLSINTINEFKIIEDKSTKVFVDENIALPRSIFKVMFSTSYAAMRGILAYKTTSLEGPIILPILDYDQISQTAQLEDDILVDD